MKNNRSLPIGAEVLENGDVHFRVWAPQHRKVEVVFDGLENLNFPLQAEASGYFAGATRKASAGACYRFRLDEEERLYPDPASRFQPDGPHGPSQVVHPRDFPWTDQAWRGVKLKGQMIYEMHIGTFTRAGTWAAAQAELAELAELGVTVLEVMPVADFAGRFGWGYDGVNLFAPSRLYGQPDDFRRFIDHAHALGLGVILDVVYNHLGPDGNYLKRFAEDYFSTKHKTEWGEALNYDGPNSQPVREYILTNAAYWITEYHLDGLRLDATQSLYDDSAEHILAALTRTVRAAAKGRETLIVGENEPQHMRLVHPAERGGYGLDALWNDDFHHSAMVAMTGRTEAYYTDYCGKPQEFISAAKYGFLYQGQWYRWQQRRRGSSDLRQSPAAFITFLQNHDQVANSGRGERCHRLTSPGRYRALTALLLLGPGTPMLFQGQEFASSSPFYYFADFEGELKRLVREGRAAALAQFRGLATPEMQAALADPGDLATFERSKLDFAERERHAHVYQLHRELLQLRRNEAVFRAQQPDALDGAVLGAEAFVLRFFGDDLEGHADRLLLINLGVDLVLSPAPEPLLAPPSGQHWDVLWSSEDPRYGGLGTPPLETTANWLIPGHAAVVLQPAAGTTVVEASLIHPEVQQEMLLKAAGQKLD
ncbi:MAG: malto-oligosyltrehalose trehalohydrolase [Acidobacteria bacterium]|nr:malto-oligosyltrehalose trehalohydrolase [Acidobacteriota bacterium]